MDDVTATYSLIVLEPDADAEPHQAAEAFAQLVGGSCVTIKTELFSANLKRLGVGRELNLILTPHGLTTPQQLAARTEADLLAIVNSYEHLRQIMRIMIAAGLVPADCRTHDPNNLIEALNLDRTPDQKPDPVDYQSLKQAGLNLISQLTATTGLDLLGQLPPRTVNAVQAGLDEIGQSLTPFRLKEHKLAHLSLTPARANSLPEDLLRRPLEDLTADGIRKCLSETEPQGDRIETVVIDRILEEIQSALRRINYRLPN
jgi:hypothetical protein